LISLQHKQQQHKDENYQLVRNVTTVDCRVTQVGFVHAVKSHSKLYATFIKSTSDIFLINAEKQCGLRLTVRPSHLL